MMETSRLYALKKTIVGKYLINTWECILPQKCFYRLEGKTR